MLKPISILALSWAKKGQTDEAIRQFEETIRLKPDFAEAHYNLGTALGMKGQINQAISEFRGSPPAETGFCRGPQQSRSCAANKEHSVKSLMKFRRE